MKISDADSGIFGSALTDDQPLLRATADGLMNVADDDALEV
jgi:hypothetical protein